MTKSSKSVENVLRSTYPLQIAARCSDDVEKICQKNSLSFTDLLRPFSIYRGPCQLKDVQGHQYTVRNVFVQFTAPSSEPVPETKLRIDLGNRVKNYSSSPKGSTPWYESYRDTFLSHHRQTESELIKHYVCVVMVISSLVADPLDSFSSLYSAQKQSEQQGKYPKWLIPHMLYYYVLLHDASVGGDARAKDNFDKVEGTYGKGSCFFLRINSRSSGSPGKEIPDLWSDIMGCNHETTNGTDETDGLKIRFKRSKKRSPPQADEVPDPTKVREEASLSSNSSSESDQLSSLSNATTDPLSGLGVQTTIHHALSSGEISQTSESYLPNGLADGHGYGGSLSVDDHRRLSGFVEELVSRRLLPHLTEVLKNLNEWLVSRRSVRRSFSSFSNRILKSIQGSNNAATEGYAANSLEMQLRQLGDVAFFTQSYELAFQSYHHVKKDFQSSSAWPYYAAAVEMCAVSAYMCSSTKREVLSYLEEAISVYNLSCKSPYHALRCSLLLTEILKERGLFKELTQLLIRMTTEDDDLRSALCLEQAAYAYQRTVPAMNRKFGLHLILAGHRFARSTQRIHSTRVYSQALDIYREKGWTLAEDYIHFSLARHSFTLHRLSAAREAFETLLSHESLQSPAQQLLNLKEYIFVYKQVLSLELEKSSLAISPPSSRLSEASSARCLPKLPLPFVNTRLTQVTFLTGASTAALAKPHPILGDVQSESTPPLGEYLTSRAQQNDLILGVSDHKHSVGGCGQWEELEVRAAGGPAGTLHENFKPSVLMMGEATDNSTTPVCVVNEAVSVGLALRNPLKIPLLMRDVSLVWAYRHTPAHDDPSNESAPPEAECGVLQSLLLGPEEQKMVTLTITPLREGHLTVTGFLYKLCLDSSQIDPASDSALLGNHSRPNLPSMTVSSQDVLYQKRNNSGEEMVAGIQGRVEIEIQGPRLNRSKDERAGVVYGHDHRLSWNVTAPMPKLVACLSGVRKSMSSGEVCRVGVELFNCGQVPLNSLRIATSLGERVLLDRDCDTSSSAVCPVYPSSLLSPINTSPPPTSQPHFHRAPHCVELPLPHGRLEPRTGLAVRLIMQGASSLIRNTSSEVPLDILLYYEPALVSANSRLSHRVLRHSMAVKINESLQLKTNTVHGQLPELSPQRFDMNQVVVTLEADNKLSPGVSGEVRVTQVSCVSQKWRISKLDKQQGLLCLQPSESGMVQLKATPLDSPTQEVCYSDVPLGPTMIPSNTFPTGDLLRGDQLQEHPDSMILVVFWQALVPGSGNNTEFSYGHQIVSVKLPQSLSSLQQATPPSPYDLVKFYLDHPTSHTLSQSTSGLCQIPVGVVLQNCCHNDVTAMVEFIQPKDSPSAQDSKRPSEPTFFWTGGTCKRHVRLLANSSQSVTVFANFSQPGLYNLNTIRVLVARANTGNYSVQRWQRTSYIMIHKQ